MKSVPNRHNQGSALLMSLLLLGVVTGILATYLARVNQERYSMSRSLAWNAALPVAEAGIEEALTQINSHDMKLVADNGWSLAGQYLVKSKWVAGSQWAVGISTNLPPVLIAQSTTRAPLSTNTVFRTLRVTTGRNVYFPRGLVAKGSIDLKGFNVTVDSYNSTDPNFSTNGRYDSAKRRDHGSVATNSSLKDSLNSGNAKIWGTVATGPGGAVSVGANGVVGDSSWQASGAKGVEPGAVTDDMNVSFPDIEAPTACYSAFAPNPGTVNGTNYNYILDTGYYLISGLKTFQGQVAVIGNAVLLVTSDVQFTGQDFIYIQPGASLQLYVASPGASFGGLGIYNTTGISANLLYYGLPSNTSLSYSGNATVAMAVYAPEADFSLGGGGSTALDFSGATVTGTVTMNGNFNFHFDEALSAARSPQGWIATSWDEITTPLQTILGSSIPNPL